MLESLTLVTRGGVVLYQHVASPSLVGAADASETRANLNRLLAQKVAPQLPHEQKEMAFTIQNNISYVYKSASVKGVRPMEGTSGSDHGGAVVQEDYVAILSYPDILFQGPREYLRQWAESLLQVTIQAYNHYYEASCRDSGREKGAVWVRPDPEPFDPVFQQLLTDSKTKGTSETPNQSERNSSSTSGRPSATSNSKKSSGGKDNRHWVDMDAKIRPQDMADLDQSKNKDKATSASDATSSGETVSAAALQEARLAFMPTEEDLQLEEAAADAADSTSWASSVTNVFSQLIGSKVLQDSDLKAPLQAMEARLISHNVSQEVATRLCDTVRNALRNQRLASLSRVQTAVHQALEASLRNILNPPVTAQRQSVDLLRNVLANRSQSVTSLFSLTSRQKQQHRPYVILVMGINGIGKTTTLAKLAYFFQTNGCQPLLVAGDTFRSGAVEQLKVHADCLGVPIFSQGYSKDPSSVVKAAIQFASSCEEPNDVVLVDTAGRMQNNVPLMKALGKMVQENQPDFIIQVCEALVGHDGLNQFRMFQQALGGRSTDGLVLTKFDTVGDKVGAAVTLAYETGTPIVFTGTGQKYHHLKQLSVTSVIRSLLS